MCGRSITRMLEDQTLGLLSCLVVDELHMVGEEERGYQLELLLTKLRWAGCGSGLGETGRELLQPVHRGFKRQRVQLGVSFPIWWV